MFRKRNRLNGSPDASPTPATVVAPIVAAFLLLAAILPAASAEDPTVGVDPPDNTRVHPDLPEPLEHDVCVTVPGQSHRVHRNVSTPPVETEVGGWTIDPDTLADRLWQDEDPFQAPIRLWEFLREIISALEFASIDVPRQQVSVSSHGETVGPYTVSTSPFEACLEPE